MVIPQIWSKFITFFISKINSIPAPFLQIEKHIQKMEEKKGFGFKIYDEIFFYVNGICKRKKVRSENSIQLVDEMFSSSRFFSTELFGFDFRL